MSNDLELRERRLASQRRGGRYAANATARCHQCGAEGLVSARGGRSGVRPFFIIPEDGTVNCRHCARGKSCQYDVELVP